MRITVSKTVKLLLIFIVVGALFRLWHLGTLPGMLHRDETSIGYNAYSLLLTGRDEHNVPWPLNFRAFGDYKLPGLIYATIPSIYAFGLTPFAVRLPTALAAILTIPAVFWLSREIGWSNRVSLFVALFLTLDFWHISQARNAYEPIAGLLFSVISFASWLAAKRDPRWYIGAIISYIVSSFFYNVPFLLLPLLFIGTWLVSRNWSTSSKIKKPDTLVIAALVTTIVCTLGIAWLMQGVNASRTNITVFSHQDIVDTSQAAVHAGLVSGLPSLISRTLSHQLVMGMVQIGQGYVGAFNPSYLFFIGDNNAWHNLRTLNLGNINPVLLLGFLTGIYLLIKKSDQSSKITGIYLLLSPAISAITIDSPVTNRLLDFHVAVIIVAAVGADYWCQELWNKRQVSSRLLFWFASTVYISFFVFFVFRYFFLFNPLMNAQWNPGTTQLVSEVTARAENYNLIFITSNLELSHTFFAFYTPFDPADLQQQAVWIKPGFELISEYRQFRFTTFPKWYELESKQIMSIFDDQHHSILIAGRGNPEQDLSEKTGQKVATLWESKDWHGQWQWYLWETNLDQALLEIRSLPTSADRTMMIDYLKSCQEGKCNKNIVAVTE